MASPRMTETFRMIHKVNQIAAFYEPYPKPKALAGVAGHINSFWTPAMRAQLIEHIRNDGEGLNPLVLEIVDLIDE
jgi:formate dehydrogenase subunit delta